MSSIFVSDGCWLSCWPLPGVRSAPPGLSTREPKGAKKAEEAKESLTGHVGKGGGTVTGPHNLRAAGQISEWETGFFLGFLVSENELSSFLESGTSPSGNGC